MSGNDSKWSQVEPFPEPADGYVLRCQSGGEVRPSATVTIEPPLVCPKVIFHGRWNCPQSLRQANRWTAHAGRQL